MKNSSQIITIILSILFFGYIFYTYNPAERIAKTQEFKNEGIGLFGLLGMNPLDFKDGSADTIYMSDKGEIDLLQKMFIEYNNMNANGVAEFFADTCDFQDLKGKTHKLTHENFANFFNNMDSVKWMPLGIVPVRVHNQENWRTATIVHSIEERYPKDGEIWTKELIEVFYIKEEKINEVNQFGKESNNTW